MGKIANMAIFTAFICLVATPAGFAGNISHSPNQSFYIRPVFNYATIWAHSDDLETFAWQKFPSFEINIGKQTTGEKAWEYEYNFPSYGGGTAIFDFADPSLGTAVSGFGYVNFCLTRSKDISFLIRLATGVGYFSNIYDPEDNPENLAVSTPLNVYFNLGAHLKFSLSDHLSLSAGGGLAHFSNGAFRKPNRGLNIFKTSVALRYNFYPDISYHREPPDQPEKKKTGFTMLLAGGVMQPKEGDPNYNVQTFSFNLTQKLNHVQRWGAGFDFFYNSKVSEELASQNKPDTFIKTLRNGIYISHELLFENLAIVKNLGIYLPHEINPPKPYYQRLGLRYYITENSMVNVSLIAHRAVAEVVEWGVGYSF